MDSDEAIRVLSRIVEPRLLQHQKWIVRLLSEGTMKVRNAEREMTSAELLEIYTPLFRASRFHGRGNWELEVLVRLFSTSPSEPWRVVSLAGEEVVGSIFVSSSSTVGCFAETTKRFDLTAAMFDECPVWVGDFGDGFAPAKVWDPLPHDQGEILLRATLITPTDVRIDGCVKARTNYLAVAFVGGEELHFNCHLRSMSNATIERLNVLLPEAKGQLFPLRYETDFHYEGEPPIRGVFDFVDGPLDEPKR